MRTSLPRSEAAIAWTYLQIPIVFILLFATYTTSHAQFSCTTGNLYGVRAASSASVPTPDDLKNLYRIDPVTGDPSLLVNLFGAAPANSAIFKATAAIGLDPYNNLIYYCSNNARNPDAASYIYSYNLTNGTFSSRAARLPFAGNFGNTDNWNKAAFNPVDRKVYFHEGINNRIAIYDPAAPLSNSNPGLANQSLSVPGLTSPGSFTGGDIAFDGLGNLTAVFYAGDGSSSVVAVFPGVFNAAGVYQGVSVRGERVFDFSATQVVTGAGFRSDGSLLVSFNSFTNPVIALNPATQTQTPIPGNKPGFSISDLTSCVFPSPNITGFSNRASFSCSGTQTSIVYTIKIKNNGQFIASNALLYDTLPAGVTVRSVTVNGTQLAGVNNASLRQGIPIQTPGDAAGVLNIGATDTAIVVINATAAGGQATYTNRAWLSYNGIQVAGITRLGSDNPATPAANDATSITTTCLQVSGNVFNDANGLTDNTINGTGTNGGGLNVVIVDNTSGNVLGTTAVPSNGNFTVSGIPAGTHTALITTATATAGSPAPAIAFPNNYTATGEGTAIAGDGTPNGSTSITLTSINLNGVVFGIEQLPSTTTGTTPAFTNPGGVTQITLPATSFGGTDPDGTLTALRITGFPTNTIAITINGTTYTSATFPAAGITIPANSNGQPVQAVSIDPDDGVTSVVITYTVIDNANKEDATPGTLTVPFNAGTIAGTVYNDHNGIKDHLINGDGTNAGGLNAVLVNPATGLVLSTVSVAGNGTYTITGLGGGNYNLLLTTNSATAGSPAPVIALPANWVYTGEGTALSGDGMPDGLTILTVTNGQRAGVNFGINQRPSAHSVKQTIPQPVHNQFITLDGSGSNPAPPSGTDPEHGLIGPGDSIFFTQVPVNAELYYDNGSGPVLLANNTIIGNLKPSSLQLKFTTLGSTKVNFRYMVVDEAGVASSAPGDYEVNFAAPLPVTLKKFTLNKEGKNILLQWVTSSEQNTLEFVVERSNVISGNWGTIGKVPAAGNSNNERQYSFPDAMPANGNNFYRLRVMDRDGQFTFSEVRSAFFTGEDRFIRVYPNPVNAVLNIVREASVNGKCDAQLVDQYGRVVKILQITSTSTEVNMRSLANGIYFLKYFHQDGSTQTIRILKE